MFIQEKLYKEILNYLPLLCVDLIITNKESRFLLVKRVNAPLKDEFWVPGGRLFIKENVFDAAARIMSSELGWSCNIDELKLVGLYQDLFKENSFHSDVDYHTVSLVFEFAELNDDKSVNLDVQSSEWKWSDNLPERLIEKMILF